MSNPTHLCWCDLETTDVDPFVAHAAPLEVGIIVTEWHPDLPEVARANIVLRPPGGQPDHDLLWARMDPVVRDMHTSTGLWQEATVGDNAWNLAEADAALRDWLTEHVGPGTVPIAGSGVGHMDQPWVKSWFPALATKLTYWPLDTGDVRRSMELAGRSDLVDLATDVYAKPHRALGDVELHVAEARRYLRLLQQIPAVEVIGPVEVVDMALHPTGLGAVELVEPAGALGAPGDGTGVPPAAVVDVAAGGDTRDV